MQTNVGQWADMIDGIINEMDPEKIKQRQEQ